MQSSDKVASDVKASIPAELEAWRKLKSLKERKKQLTYYYYDALKSMSMAEMEEMVTVLLARNCSARGSDKKRCVCHQKRRETKFNQQ